MEPDVAARIADLLTRTNRRLRRAAGDAAPPGVTPSRLRVLRILSGAGSPLRVGELARRLDVVPRSATSVVDELEAAGYVRREPDPADRRATLVALTSFGADVLRDVRAGRNASLAQLLDRLTEPEQADLIRLLAKLAADG